MKKKYLAILLAITLFIGCTSALAIDAGQERVTIGANLDEAQRAQIYSDFGIAPGSVKELTVSNAEERAYLEGLVDTNKIGSVSLSCIYIKTLEAGAGLKISTHNINWCTQEMYVNALSTAGITDAEVHVSAPFAVSGTAALTGVYKAYEDITGTPLDPLAKMLAAQEIVVTGDLKDMLGSVDATTLVNELKLILDQTKNMNDDEVRAEIKAIAKHLNIQLTDAQIEQLLSLCRSLEKLDSQQLAEKVKSITTTLETASQAQKTFTSIITGVKNFFVSIGDFFVNLFKPKS